MSENLLPSKPKLYALPPHIDIPSRLNLEIPLVASMDEFNQIKEYLHKAGEKLGLFSQINITENPTVGKGYALEVTIDNHTHSIVDAGFGVYSVLPYLKAVIKNSDATVLMQQPETHLHPRAQDMLSDLMVKTAGRYIIETHADHIINRLSISVREQEISPADATIFWFEKDTSKSNGTIIHPIGFDKDGNLIEPPPDYRKFFIQAQEKFLGLN